MVSVTLSCPISLFPTPYPHPASPQPEAPLLTSWPPACISAHLPCSSLAPPLPPCPILMHSYPTHAGTPWPSRISRPRWTQWC